MPYFKDLTGKKFNRLTVISQSKERRRGMIQWDCICECGGGVKALSARLSGGYIKSCGCLALEMAKKRKNRLTHGLSKTRIYSIWAGMKKRCNNYCSNHSSYIDKDVTYCKDWEKFENFYKDMANGYLDSLTLDRIDNNGDYCKENCRWSNQSEQARNRSTSTRVKLNNEFYTLAELAEKYRLNYNTLESRINKLGWSVEDAIQIRPYGKWGPFRH